MSLPRYTLVHCLEVEQLLGQGLKLRLQFRGRRIFQGERVLVNGTLPEVIAFARREHGEAVAQTVISDAVALQRRRSPKAVGSSENGP